MGVNAPGIKTEKVFRNYFIIEKDNWFGKLKISGRVRENRRKLVVYNSMVANQAMDGMIQIVVVGKGVQACQFHRNEKDKK